MRLLLLISLSGCLILLAQAKPVSYEVRINRETDLEDVQLGTAPVQSVGIRGRRFAETTEAAKTEQRKAVGANGTEGRGEPGGKGGQSGQDGQARQGGTGGKGGLARPGGPGGQGGSSGRGGQAGRQSGTGGQGENARKGGLGRQSVTGGQARQGGIGRLRGSQGGKGAQAGRQGGTCGYGSRSIRRCGRIYRLKRKNGNSSRSGQDGFPVKSQKSPGAASVTAKPVGFIRYYMLHSVPN